MRYLDKGITLVSERLKNTIITHKYYQIIRKAEGQLLCECVKTINSTKEVRELQRNTCIGQFSRVLDGDSLRECQAFISRVREARHQTSHERQKKQILQAVAQNNG